MCHVGRQRCCRSLLHVCTLAVVVLCMCTRRRWRPKLYKQAPRKVGAHTAMSDIKESLTELRYYKKCLFGGK